MLRRAVVHDHDSSGLAGMPFATQRRFRRGEFLVEAGCPADALYLVRSGQVRAFLLEEDGRETTTAILGPGQLVGLAPVFGRVVHREFAQALTPIEAWALPVGPFRERLPDDEALLGLVVGALAQRISVVTGLLRDVALLTVSERARDIEARLAACLGGSRPALNRSGLARLIQARPETLARCHPDATPVAAPPYALDDRSGTWTFRPGEVVLEADLPPGRIGRVLVGEVQLLLAATGGRSMLVETLCAGDLFGFGALLGLAPVGLQLVAVSAGAVEVLPTRELLTRLADQPDALRGLVARLGIRLERLERHLAGATATDTRARLLEVLREEARPDGLVPANWSHTALARQIGVRRETVTRALAALGRAGVIRRERHQIRL